MPWMALHTHSVRQAGHSLPFEKISKNENDNTFENTRQFSITKSDHLRPVLPNTALITGAPFPAPLHLQSRPHSNEGRPCTGRGSNRELSTARAARPCKWPPRSRRAGVDCGYPLHTPRNSSRSGNILLISQKQ